VSLRRTLNRPDWRGRLWQTIYAGGYACLKGAVALTFSPFFRVRMVGPPVRLPATGGVLICPNHTSYLDPAFVQIPIKRRVTYVMTNDFYKSPWGRWFFKLVGAIPVGSPRLARKGLRRAEALLRMGHAVVVFPEGRLSRDDSLSPGQRGIARLALRAGVPVYPLAVCGARRALAPGRLRPTRTHVRMRFARPLSFEGPRTREGEQAFADDVMDRIARTRTWIYKRHPARIGPRWYPERP